MKDAQLGSEVCVITYNLETYEIFFEEFLKDMTSDERLALVNRCQRTMGILHDLCKPLGTYDTKHEFVGGIVDLRHLLGMFVDYWELLTKINNSSDLEALFNETGSQVAALVKVSGLLRDIVSK